MARNRFYLQASPYKADALLQNFRAFPVGVELCKVKPAGEIEARAVVANREKIVLFSLAKLNMHFPGVAVLLYVHQRLLQDPHHLTAGARRQVYKLEVAFEPSWYTGFTPVLQRNALKSLHTFPRTEFEILKPLHEHSHTLNLMVE